MKKIRLYLDTTVISYLEALDTPEKMQETLTLWEDIKARKYEIVLSSVVFDEIDRCYQPKRDNIYQYVNEIEFENTKINATIREIAEEILKMGILKEKSRDDSLHIGCAVYQQCDYIVSWNFKHLVNINTVNGVRMITNLFRYKSIDIIPPSMLINREDK